MKIITVTQFEKWKLYVLHIIMLRFSGKVWWQKDYDGYSGIKYDNWKRKKQFWQWRGKECIWTLHIEIRNLKIYICRFSNGA